MTDSLARMMAPRIAVATSLEHFTPRPTWPLLSPIATNAWIRKQSISTKFPPKLLRHSNCASHSTLQCKPAMLGSRRPWFSRAENLAPHLEPGALSGASLLLHRHDLEHLVFQRRQEEVDDLELLQHVTATSHTSTLTRESRLVNLPSTRVIVNRRLHASNSRYQIW